MHKHVGIIKTDWVNENQEVIRKILYHYFAAIYDLVFDEKGGMKYPPKLTGYPTQRVGSSDNA